MKRDYLICSFCLVLVLPLTTAASWALRSFSNLIRSNVRCFDMPVKNIDSESGEKIDTLFNDMWGLLLTFKKSLFCYLTRKREVNLEHFLHYKTNSKIPNMTRKTLWHHFSAFFGNCKKTWVVGQKHIW